MGQRGHLRRKRHLCEPKGIKTLVGEESNVHGLKGGKQHEVTGHKGGLEWLEFGIVKVPMRTTREARSWSLPGHVKRLDLIL